MQTTTVNSVTDLKIPQQQQPISTKHYSRTNAYTMKPACQQIMTLLMFIAHLAMHCVFVIRPILMINEPILYVIWGVFWVTIVIIAYDYCILTCRDPVDQLLLHQQLILQYKLKSAQYQAKSINSKSNTSNIGIVINQPIEQSVKNPYRLRQCKLCKKWVTWHSYHCMTCRRCSQYMDHHCKYLNNCIGSKNYLQFFRLLSMTSLYFIIGIGIGIWVFVRASLEDKINQAAFSRWAVLVWIIFGLLWIVLVQTLLWFHCYITCCRKMTTIQYLFRDTQSNRGSSSNTQ